MDRILTSSASNTKKALIYALGNPRSAQGASRKQLGISRGVAGPTLSRLQRSVFVRNRTRERLSRQSRHLQVSCRMVANLVPLPLKFLRPSPQDPTLVLGYQATIVLRLNPLPGAQDQRTIDALIGRSSYLNKYIAHHI
jgi:hypothetical protein